MRKPILVPYWSTWNYSIRIVSDQRSVPFPEDFPAAELGTPIRVKTPISAPDMTKALNVHAHNAGERTAFTMHSFRSEEALARALAGEYLPTVMQRAFW